MQRLAARKTVLGASITSERQIPTNHLQPLADAVKWQQPRIRDNQQIYHRIAENTNAYAHCHYTIFVTLSWIPEAEGKHCYVSVRDQYAQVLDI